MMKRISFTLNKSEVTLDVYPYETLAEVLRNRLRCKEVKVGCWSGECGACTILLNGKAVVSCLILAPEVDGMEVITVKGLVKNGKLNPLQQAFIEEGAIQCGYCTPGFILTAYSFLRETPNPTLQDIRRALAGNLCRCGCYPNIVRAVVKTLGGGRL